MLNLADVGPRTWSVKLQPIVGSSGYKEPFSAWWSRHQEELGHLHPKLMEQWIYRHWDDTEFAFIPLDTLSWELREMEGDEILRDVRREITTRLEPEFDYAQFQGMNGFPKTQTAIELDEGTWEFPIVALSTPSGWVTRAYEHPHDYIELPNERLMLLEGHQRHRYLNALHHRGNPPKGPHAVFVVSSPIIP